MTMTATPRTRARPDAAAAARRAFAAIAGMLARFAAEVARRRRDAAARAALEGMDDKMLADIGLSRADIAYRVLEGRDPGTSPRGWRSRAR
ncbi:DUF1127 domain-containing protein [Salinarimonas sp.]|uniref:DUF1127 domain-containing protein n=1 Tax=Salinarimonas sp. TaxID=2766526 RepID=UPI0032D9562A